jgi:hypothetical protein
MHGKLITKALTVDIVQWLFKKSQGLGAPDQNNTIAGQQKLNLLHFICSSYGLHI